MGLRRETTQGYIEVWTGREWEREHRWVMARFLGRKLVSGETVRHRDNDRHNNKLENLELRHTGSALGSTPEETAVHLVQHHRALVQEVLAANVAQLPHDDARERVAIIFTTACGRTKMTNTALAAALGIDSSYLSQMMRRRRPVPAAMLLRVLDLAGTPLEAVLPS